MALCFEKGTAHANGRSCLFERTELSMEQFRYGTVKRYPVSYAGETAEIGTIDELMVALDVLNRRNDRELIEQLAPVLADIINIGDRIAPANLKILLKALSAQDRLYVVELLGPRLGELVGTAVELRNLIVSLADVEVESAILRAIGGNGLRRLIATCQQLWEILEWLFGESDVVLLDLLGPDYVRRLVAHGHELAEILRRVDPDRQIWTIEFLGWPVALSLLRDDVDFREVLSALCTEASAKLIDRLPNTKIVELVASELAWLELGRHLSPSKTRLLSDKLGRRQDAP